MHGGKKSQAKRKAARAGGFKNLTEAREFADNVAKKTLEEGKQAHRPKAQEKADSIIKRGKDDK